MTAIALFLASFGYAGLAPIAPGTFGSLAGLVVYAGLRFFDLVSLEPAVIAGLSAVGVWAASATARDLGNSDPGVVVIDEVVGMLITVAFLPVSVVGAGVGFLAFRAFDIIKPFPAAQSERLQGGLGIMADDVFAGLYAHLVVRVLAWGWPAWMLHS
jgi:phosphatidylglycerophosphatase A